MKYIISLSLMLVVIFLSGCSLINAPVTVNQSTSTISTIPPGNFYFYSTNCAHCATVNQYVVEHDTKANLFYIEAPIDNNEEHVKLLQQIGQRCGLPLSSLGVPFFWDGQRCYQGADEVINYFQTL